jgi:hypothetical protein
MIVDATIADHSVPAASLAGSSSGISLKFLMLTISMGVKS